MSSVPAVQRPLCRREPNHALQRTEAGRHVFSRSQLLRGQPLSLSLGPLGPRSCVNEQLLSAFASALSPPLASSLGHVFQMSRVAGVRYTSGCLGQRFSLWLARRSKVAGRRRPPRLGGARTPLEHVSRDCLFRTMASRSHPFGRAFTTSTDGRTRDESRCRSHGPNHALQRTEAGRWLFSRWQLLRGQPLSLSLEPLGQQSLPGGFNRRACSRSLCCRWRACSEFGPAPVGPRSGRPVVPSFLSARPPLRSCLSGGSTPHSPAGVLGGPEVAL